MQIYLRFFCVNQKKVVSLRVFWKILYVMIKEIPDFPKPGIRFLEITPFLLNPDEVREAISAFCEQIKPLTAEGQVLIIGPDARGFIFSSMVAYDSCCAKPVNCLTMARKSRLKLPKNMALLNSL